MKRAHLIITEKKENNMSLSKKLVTSLIKTAGSPEEANELYDTAQINPADMALFDIDAKCSTGPVRPEGGDLWMAWAWKDKSDGTLVFGNLHCYEDSSVPQGEAQIYAGLKKVLTVSLINQT